MDGDTEFWTSHVEACRPAKARRRACTHGSMALTLASLYYWRRKLKLAAAVGDGSGPTNKFFALRVHGFHHAIGVQVDALAGLERNHFLLISLSKADRYAGGF